MLRPREHAEEASEYHLEPVLRILRRKVWNGRLFPDDELDLGDEVDDKLAVRAYRVLQRAPPPGHVCFALGEDLTDKGLEGLCQGRVGDVALVLVELSGSEQAARRNQRLVQLMHHERFADTGITRYEHEFWCAVGHDAVERGEQGIDLALAPIQFFRDQQPVR